MLFMEDGCMNTLRRGLVLLASLFVALSALSAQNAATPPKYRSHFVVYDLSAKTTRTLFTLDGEWHAPNFTPDGLFIISDMGGDLYRIPVSGARAGQPEKINLSRKMEATNDHSLSWDGKQIAITGITPPTPAKIRNPGDIHNPLFIMIWMAAVPAKSISAGSMAGHPMASSLSTPSITETTSTSTGSTSTAAANSS
jgi:Tol biopolymer transport system component